ncbi:secreted frizzled-related protein 3 [Rhincodon typus]|uniref:secreted frizzled-related protein 3 n=1 Tax=Rhincodon typus TaxID=259920 RepID=UPI00202F02EC|nr:secreted frizzled-related protein 3 [Rhincodon typus]
MTEGCLDSIRCGHRLLSPSFRLERGGNCFDLQSGETSPHISASSTESCKCPAVKLTQKVYLKNNYNYVIRAKVKEVRNKCHDVATTVEVKDVLKSSLVNIPKETVTLHTSSACLCPEIKTNEEYVIMGYEDEERARLLLVEGSIAVKWKDRLGKRIKNWDQKLRQERRKGRSGLPNREKRLQPRDTAVASKQRKNSRNAKSARH